MKTRGNLFRTGALAALTMLVLGLTACQDDAKPTQPVKRSLDEIQWVGTSVVYDSAAEKKAHSLIFFTASWCGWCTKLKDETLCNASVQDEINAHYNPVLIEITSDTLLVYRDTTVRCCDLPGIYSVGGYPTTFVLDSYGNTVAQWAGYCDAPTMLGRLQAVRGGP